MCTFSAHLCNCTTYSNITSFGVKEMKRLLIIIFFFIQLGQIQAQSPLEVKADLVVQEVDLETALNVLMDESGIPISFVNKILPAYLRISLQVRNKPLATILDKLLKDTNLAYKTIGNQIVLYAEKPPSSPPLTKHTLSGYLEDAATGERLIGANVYDQTTTQGTVSNEYGFFSITLPAGEHKIAFSYLGYKVYEKKIQLTGNQLININLKPSLTLKEVVVIAVDSAINSSIIDQNQQQKISLKAVNNLPSLGGEPDLIRTMQLLPGVQTGPDGIGGLHIRGGSIDQNLTLIDGVPVYNPSHALGVFSIFNTGAIRTSQLIKGSFPARYSGRLSSVLDVRTKEGNLKEFHGEANIGLVASRMTIEGPLVKNKTAFLLSARTSLINFYLKPFSQNAFEKRGSNGETNYNFYDINAKLHHKFSNRDQIYISFYKGRDNFDSYESRSSQLLLIHPETGDTLSSGRSDLSAKRLLGYGNTVAAFRWNHLWTNKLFSNTTLTFSRYFFNDDFNTSDSLVLNQRTISKQITFIKNQSSIQDFAAKVDFDYVPVSNHYVRFGAGVTQHRFAPGVLAFNENSEINEQEFNINTSFSNDSISSTEYDLYFEDDVELTPKWKINFGVHLSGLLVGRKKYNSIQPRFSSFWDINSKVNLRASIGTQTQYLHLLNSSNIGLTTDLWVSSTEQIPPEDAWQVDLAASFKIGQHYNLSIESYFKRMNNLITYVEGANTLTDWENNVTLGNGNAYGVEFLLQKKIGKTTGWLAYTLSFAERQFNEINFGRIYPYRYDRRHNVQLAVMHRFTPNIEVSLNYIYGTGLAFTLPEDKFLLFIPGDPSPPEVIINRNKRNNFRMPAYHRLDAGINFKKVSKNITQAFHVGVYNVYNQRQPLYFAVRNTPTEEDLLNREIVTIEILPLVPALSYGIKF